VPGWSTRSLLTNKAVPSLRINQGPTVTFIWHEESSQAADLLRFSLLRRQASTHMTILALPEASLHDVRMKQPEKKPAVPGCSNWTSHELRLPKCRDDPRRLVLAANRPEECQRRMTSRRDMIVLDADAKKAGSASLHEFRTRLKIEGRRSWHHCRKYGKVTGYRFQRRYC